MRCRLRWHGGVPSLHLDARLANHLAEPGVLGRPVDGGWDRVLVSAAPRELPDALVEQVAEGGRMVIPVRSTMHLVRRVGGQVLVTTHGSYTFVPLR